MNAEVREMREEDGSEDEGYYTEDDWYDEDVIREGVNEMERQLGVDPPLEQLSVEELVREMREGVWPRGEKEEGVIREALDEVVNEWLDYDVVIDILEELQKGEVIREALELLANEWIDVSVFLEERPWYEQESVRGIYVRSDRQDRVFELDRILCVGIPRFLQG